MKYYSSAKIRSYNAEFNVIFGERSNGKTYDLLKLGIEEYLKDGSELAIVRRWQEDFVGKRGQQMFDAIVSNDEVKKLSKGKWTGVYYYSSRWWLCFYDDKGNRIMDNKPFAYGFAISSMEHDKSTSYPNITNIVFDEFLSRQGYLPDEFVLFMNTCSTIIRQRTNVKIYMLGNTVNKYCPYFSEMGLKHIKNMKPGDIDVYKYGDSGLTVAVEYCKPNSQGKASDIYFAFDNPKLHMITGGEWEIDIYPHLPMKYRPKDVLFTFYVIFDREILQGNVIEIDNALFIYYHRKTTPIKFPDDDLIFSTEVDPRPNWCRDITNNTNSIVKKIIDIMNKEKVFYQDNEVGEIINNYLVWCGKER